MHVASSDTTCISLHPADPKNCMEATPWHFHRLSTQQLLNILYLVWLELNQRWTHATDDSGFIPNDSIIAAPAQDIPQPAAGEWLDPQEHQEQATDSICGEKCRWCDLPCRRYRNWGAQLLASSVLEMEDQIGDEFD